MKRIGSLLLLASLVLVTLISSAHNGFAQGRSIGAQELILDNGAGGKLTISYTGTGDQTLVIGDGGIGGGSLPEGTEGQTLRHNGTTYESSSTLINTGTQVQTTGGVVHALRSVNQSTELTESDHIILAYWADCAEIAITLPPPTSGRVIIVKMINNCSDCQCPAGVSVIPNNGESIDGMPSFNLSNFVSAVQLVSDGTNWFSIGTALNPL